MTSPKTRPVRVGGYLLVLVATVLIILFAPNYYVPILAIQDWAVAIVALGVFEVYFIRLVPRKTLLWLFVFGVAITLFSGLHPASLSQPGPCYPGIAGGGFPLPWYLTFVQYTGHDVLPCPLFVNRDLYLRLSAVFSFLFDTAIYATLGFAVRELIVSSRRRPVVQTAELSS